MEEKMGFSKKQMDDLLTEARISINNAKNNEDLKVRLAEFGYDEAALNEGYALYEKAEKLCSAKRIKYSEQYIVSNELNRKIEKANEHYMNFVKVLRKAFKRDFNTLTALGLKGERSKRLAGWIAQAKDFYDIAMSKEDIFTKLQRYGITKEKLQTGLDLLADVETTDEYQENLKGKAQYSTEERDKVVQELDDWMAPYEETCRIAFKDEPQQLERLKIPALSEDYKKSKRRKKGEKEEPEEQTE
jgi:hypothetical protein